MHAGRLRCRITLERPVETAAPSGAPALRWERVGRFWAAVEPIRGREYFSANQIRDEVDAKITLRYMQGIEVTPCMRIRHQETLYNIQSVIDVKSAHRTLELMCQTKEVRNGR